MKPWHLAIAASLAAAASASHADIDLGSLAVASASADPAALLLAIHEATAVGAVMANNNDVIYQDASLGANEQTAYIAQQGTQGGLAAILQLGNAAGIPSVDMIVQAGTTNSRLVIVQR